MGDLLDALAAFLEWAVRWLRIFRHRLCCERPIRWVATCRAGRSFTIPRCDECRIERVLVEKGWRHAAHR